MLRVEEVSESDLGAVDRAVRNPIRHLLSMLPGWLFNRPKPYPEVRRAARTPYVVANQPPLRRPRIVVVG